MTTETLERPETQTRESDEYCKRCGHHKDEHLTGDHEWADARLSHLYGDGAYCLLYDCDCPAFE